MNIPQSFHEMHLPKSLLQVLDKLNYLKPTAIQSKTIPIAIKNHDILGSAQTGTGKTLAFIIPLIVHLLNNPNGSALILTPTRELAYQILEILKKLLANSKLYTKVALLIGGEPIYKQFNKLKTDPKVVVGTPGRVIDHLSRKTLNPNFSFLILDEMDRMFDMGFGIQLEKIISQLPKSRQTLMFSATLPKNIEKLAAKYLIKPERIAIDPIVRFPEKLTEQTINIKSSEKFSILLEQLKNRSGAIIIFVKTKNGAEVLSDNLRKNNHYASAMHGDLKQPKRHKVMNDFRNGRSKIMVATDLAARGLDVPEIQHVINYDLPNRPEDYIHRVGRTARAGATGAALNLVSSADQSKWHAIQKFRTNTKNPNKIKKIQNYRKVEQKVQQYKKFRKNNLSLNIV